jgi:hypothetical protein
MTTTRERATEQATRLMLAFAERTGLASGRTRTRYLWTDAFAVCNFLALERATGEQRYRALALELVDQVHHVLGRHRPDDARSGWLSGLDEREGESHPTLGGLRIGKPRPERAPAEPFDDALEWDRDGQYFHYLTKWMHALDQVSRSTGDPRFHVWARELAAAAHAAFVYRPSERSGPRMMWKASIDLSRPLVAAMGQHDALDGLVTCAQLEASAALLTGAPREPSLDRALADFAAMLDERALASEDPLGLGGLMMDAARVAQLVARGAFARAELLVSFLAAALVGFIHYNRQRPLQQFRARRVEFRELGLAIGLHAIELIDEQAQLRGGAFAGDPRFEAGLRALREYVPLAATIESYWLDPAHRDSVGWQEHRDINEVMLATSLVPSGCLVLHAPG